MKEAIINSETKVTLVDSPVPKPGPGEVLIKVIVSGTNPKDWKIPLWMSQEYNTGDDIAGTVEALGSDVFGLAKGDRVAAFHVMMEASGSYAEYAIAPQHTVFPIPTSTSFEEAATIPLAAYTSAVALFHELEYPSPWDKAAKAAVTKDVKKPLVIYGASTAIGAFGIKLAKLAGIHPIIAVGSKNSEFVRPFLDATEGDTIVDYTKHKTPDELIGAIKAAIKEAGVEDGRTFNVYDCVSEDQTFATLGNLLAGPPDENGRKPRLTCVLPLNDPGIVDSSVDVVRTHVGHVTNKTEEEKLFGLIWGRVFSRGLAEGWFAPHPFEVVKGGLNGLEGALKGLRDGTVRGKKMVVRIRETEGVSQ